MSSFLLIYKRFLGPSEMQFLAALALALGIITQTTTPGIDVSNYQPNVDWNSVVHNGIKFVYIKATEGKCSVI